MKTGHEYEDQVSIDFDDSIIEDSQAKKNDAILEYTNGLIDAVQYYQDIYGMTECQAKDFRAKILKRQNEEEANKKPQGNEIDEEDNNPNLFETTQDEEENDQLKENNENLEEKYPSKEEEVEENLKKKLPFKK